jgi:hypothetical protein
MTKEEKLAWEDYYLNATLSLRQPGFDEDVFKRDYAACLTAVSPHTLRIAYDVVHECDLLHRATPPDPEVIRGKKKQRKKKKEEEEEEEKKKPSFRSVRELLQKKHPVDSVLGLGHLKGFADQDELVQFLLDQGFSSDATAKRQHHGLGGFITISGGRETRKGDGVLPGQFGFCHQRCKVSKDQLGSFTKMQAEMMFGKERAEAELNKMLETPGTLSKMSFHSGGETLNIDYFLFLVTERDLKDYLVTHVILYFITFYLTDMLKRFLQSRHELRKQKDQELLSLLFKLSGNGIYGFAGLEAFNFPKTRLVTESSLRKLSFKSRLAMGSPDVYQVSLLGAVRRKGKQAYPDLLYAITSHRPEEKVRNALQVSSYILSQSRAIFLGKILVLLRCCDPRKMEIAYHGKSAAAAATQ